MINELKENARGNKGDGNDLASKFGDTAEELQHTAQEWQRRATDTAKRAWENTDSYVRDNPWPVIGSIALGCVLLGLFLGRSRD